MKAIKHKENPVFLYVLGYPVAFSPTYKSYDSDRTQIDVLWRHYEVTFELTDLEADLFNQYFDHDAWFDDNSAIAASIKKKIRNSLTKYINQHSEMLKMHK